MQDSFTLVTWLALLIPMPLIIFLVLFEFIVYSVTLRKHRLNNKEN